MDNIDYVFLAPVEGEPLSARYRGVLASFQGRSVFVTAPNGITEEATPEWWASHRYFLNRATKANDFDCATKIHHDMWDKSGALRELQKEAALAGRFDIVDYITAILNALLPLGR